MNKLAIAMLIGILACEAFGGTSMDSVFEAMSSYERDQRSEQARLSGHQYVVRWGFYKGDTALVTNDKVIIRIKGQVIFERGDSVYIKGKKAYIGGRKQKLVWSQFLKDYEKE